MLPHPGKSVRETLFQLASVLKRVARNNSGKAWADPTPFEADPMILIPMEDYVWQLAQYADEAGPVSLLVAVAYVNRILKMRRAVFTTKSAHRLLASACFVASKFNDDMSHSKDSMSKRARIKTNELGDLERELCQLLSWNLYIESPELEMVLEAIQNPHSDYWSSWFKESDCRNLKSEILSALRLDDSFPTHRGLGDESNRWRRHTSGL